MQGERARVAETVLWLIGIVGLLPLVFMLPAGFADGGGFALADFSYLGVAGAAAYAVIFVFGASLAIYLAQPGKLVLTLPALLVALMPAFANLSPTSVSADVVARLERIENPWRPIDMNLRTLMQTIDGQMRERVPVTEWEIARWEYAIRRNGDLRPLTFSTWNGGIRAVTTPYLRGDYARSGQNFVMGRSMWIFGTPEPDDVCPGADEVRHHYMSNESRGETLRSSNGCRVESTVYRRARHIADGPVTDE